MAALPYTAITSLPFSTVWGGTISGVVHNAAGQPASHRVFAIDQASGAASGAAVSDKDTGAYKMHVGVLFAGKEQTVVEITPDGSENARAFSGVIPSSTG